MKRLKITAAFIVAVALISCGGDVNAENLNDLQNNEEEINSCEKNSAADWDNFIGIDYGTNELDLEGIVGKFTGGQYAPDSSAFIYYFKRVKRAPISIWVNGKTGNVETIFIEILGKNDFFEEDVADAVEEFNIEKCDSKFFGLMAEEIIEIMGKPSIDKVLEDGVRSMSFDSENYKISVNFKFYPSQENLCSSITVSWFY